VWTPTEGDLERLNWSEGEVTTTGFDGERLVKMGSMACFEDEQWKRYVSL